MLELQLSNYQFKMKVINQSIYMYIYIFLIKFSLIKIAQSAGAVEYTDCISAEGDPPPRLQ